jgi:DNA end-binding protein Ku
MWKGTVSFGLVAIPINLYAATENNTVRFHQVHAADGGRVHYRRICEVDGQEVPYEQIVKGHDIGGGEMVILTEDDLASLPVPSVKSVDVVEFVPLASIDPIHFDRSYYLEPQPGAVKSYTLLRDALAKSGRVAIAKIALRHRESLAVLRVHTDLLVLSTMLWPDEVRTPDFAFLQQDSPPVRPQELEMAGLLIDAMSEDVFDPDKYTDDYRTALQDIIAAKIAGQEVTAPPAAAADRDLADLLTALTVSVETAAGNTTGALNDDAAQSNTPRAPAKTG